YLHQGYSPPPPQGHFSTYNVRLPILRTDSSRLFRKVSTAEKTPIIVIIPIVTPNKDNNVRVRLSRNADSANKKLSLIRVKIKNIYSDKSKYFFSFHYA